MHCFPQLWNMPLAILVEDQTLVEGQPTVKALCGSHPRGCSVRVRVGVVAALISSGVGGRWDTAVQTSPLLHLFDVSTERLETILNMPSNPENNIAATFKCTFSGCNASYQRKEHLRRHQTRHSQQEAFPCSNCDREFARRYLECIKSQTLSMFLTRKSDTLRRHVWQHHRIKEPSARAQQACEGCRVTKSRCQGGSPCSECLRRNVECIFKDQRDEEKEASVPLDPTLLSEKRDHYIWLYFETFHARWPFIHKGSFDASRETPLLVQSMVVLGMWTSGEETARKAAVDIHNNLDSAIRQQKVSGLPSSSFHAEVL